MSPLAKTFVIIILVLAVIFFGSSATLFMGRYNWRQAYEQMKTQSDTKLAALEKSFEEPKALMQRLAVENARLTSANNDLATENKSLNERTGALETQLSESNLTTQKLSKLFEEANKTIQSLHSQIQNKDDNAERLRRSEQEAIAAKDQAVRRLTRVMIDFDKLKSEHRQLQIEKTELTAQVEKDQIIFANLAKAGIDPENFTTPPIDGVVEAVNAQDQLVVLSVGKDQNVQPGFQFAVRRGGEYIGKVRVIEVYEDLSGARITFTTDNQQISVGDQVSTMNF